MRIFLVLPLFTIFSCSRDKDLPATDIYDIRSIGTLSTVEYTLGKVLEADDEGEWYKWGDRKILMSCKATVKAGINLNNLKESDIKADGETVEIKLPAPEILSFEMNPDDIQTEMTDVNGLREEFNQHEKNEILRLGEKSIRKDLNQLRLLQDANTNAVKFVKDFYHMQGFKNVIVHETAVRQ